MSEKRPPRFWRIHLSTALVAAFVMAATTAFNIAGRTSVWSGYFYGFPSHSIMAFVDNHAGNTIEISTILGSKGVELHYSYNAVWFPFRGTLINLGTMMSACLLTAIISEWITRWRILRAATKAPGDNPKRPFFQFHLSAAILMMLLAGGFLLVNTAVKHQPRSTGTTEEYYAIYGWPMIAYIDYSPALTRNLPYAVGTTIRMFDAGYQPGFDVPGVSIVRHRKSTNHVSRCRVSDNIPP
jgi:hypothetical protein